MSNNTISKEVYELDLAIKLQTRDTRDLSERFAKEHKHWTMEQWKLVIWSDELSFELVLNHTELEYGGLLHRNLIHNF